MNLQLLTAMGAVVVAWLLLLPVLAGIGIGLQFLFGWRRIDTTHVLLSPWNGLAVIFLFLQVWHFFLPIKWPAMFVAGAAAVASLWIARRELLEWARSLHIGWKLWLVLALFTLWIANRAIGPGDAFDSGAYHHGVVRWSHEHPIQPGLANLNSHFGFNNTCHLFDAMLKIGPWEHRAYHLCNSVLLFIWFSTVAISAARLFRNTGNRAQNLFNVVLLIPLVMYAVSREASSPTSDLPTSALAFAAASILIRLLTTPADTDIGETAFATVAIVLLSSAMLCSKLSAGLLAVPLSVIAMLVFVARWRGSQWLMPVLAWACGLNAALVLTWLLRGLILSGHPVYPMNFLSVPVEWRVLPETTPQLREQIAVNGGKSRIGMMQRAVASPQFQKLPSWITAPVRKSAENSTGKLAWVYAMCFAATIEVLLPLVLSLIVLCMLAMFRSRTRSDDAPRAKEWLVCAAAGSAIIIWGFLLPEPRFAASFCWILAAALISMAARSFPTLLSGARFAGILALLVTVPIAYRMLIQKVNVNAPPSLTLVFPAGPDHGFHPLPVADMETFTTFWGLKLLIPKEAFQPLWDAPLPATAAPDHRLRLLDPSNFESGFVKDQSFVGNTKVNFKEYGSK